MTKHKEPQVRTTTSMVMDLLQDFDTMLVEGLIDLTERSPSQISAAITHLQRHHALRYNQTTGLVRRNRSRIGTRKYEMEFRALDYRKSSPAA